jgi:hypothetical protein
MFISFTSFTTFAGTLTFSFSTGYSTGWLAFFFSAVCATEGSMSQLSLS